MSVEEALAARTPLGSDLAAGVDAISINQEITFTKFVRLVLPLDGYVFWVKADMVGPSALYNKAKLNAAAYGQPPRVTVAAPTLVAKGSLHYSADTRQEESENYAANRVVFTSEQEIQDFVDVAPNELYIGEFEGLRFAFSSMSPRYKQATLWHYVGFAVYADMDTQIIERPQDGFDVRNVIVSNSLPAWLALNSYFPPYGFPNPGLTFYPSFLTPQNLPPPYAAVHVVPDSTRGLAMAPRIGVGSSHSQLCAERVRVTLWGTRNFNALDFVDCVNQYSTDVNAFGITGTPVVRDEKRTQSELGTIAMKKTVEFEISYVQSRVNDIAKKYILSSVPSFYVDGVPA